MIDGTQTTVDGRPALRFERRLAHPVERVWRAVSEPAELERWFVATVPWTPRAGESFEAYGQTARVTACEPPRELAWTWGDESYRFDLRPDGDGCLLVFTHVFDPRMGPAEQHAAGWRAYLRRLETHLAGRFLSEQDAHGPWLTLDQAAGPQLRLERRYAHPVERVWRALSDPEERREWFPPDGPLEVVEQDAPRRLVATWFGDELRFELRPDGDGCVLVFTHAFADRDTAARTAAGWERCFARFDALLAGDPLGEAESLAAWPEAHERYAAEFGVDPELGRRAFAEHPRT